MKIEFGNEFNIIIMPKLYMPEIEKSRHVARVPGHMYRNKGPYIPVVELAALTQ